MSKPPFLQCSQHASYAMLCNRSRSRLSRLSLQLPDVFNLLFC